MNIDEITIGLRVRHTMQKLTGTVRRIRGFADLCATCGRPVEGFDHDITCQPSDWIYVQWDNRKDLLVAVSPAMLVPEVDIRIN